MRLPCSSIETDAAPRRAEISPAIVLLVRRVARLVTLAAIAAVMIPAATATAKGDAGLFGVNYTFQKVRAKDLSKLDQGHVKTVRWMLFWPQVERSKGNFDWSIPDSVIGDLARRHVRVLPVLYGSPRFVAKSTNTPPIGSKAARQAWQDFLHEAVKRYGHGGTYWADHAGKPAMVPQAWQVWNEPNLKSHFEPRPSPKRYGRLLKISHSAINGQDSKAKVLFAGMPGYSNDINAWRFLDRVYHTKKVSRAFDIAALHPYSANLHQMKGEVKRFRKVMRKHGDRRKPLWITEIGWGSAHPDRFGLSKGKKGQKRMLKGSFRVLKQKRSAWHIGRVLWYDFRDPKHGTGGCSFCGSAGLLTHSFHPKPAWHAFRRFTGGR